MKKLSLILLLTGCASVSSVKENRYEAIRCYVELFDRSGHEMHEKLECFYDTTLNDSMEGMKQLYPGKVSLICLGSDDFGRCELPTQTEDQEKIRKYIDKKRKQK